MLMNWTFFIWELFKAAVILVVAVVALCVLGVWAMGELVVDLARRGADQLRSGDDG